MFSRNVQLQNRWMVFLGTIGLALGLLSACSRGPSSPMSIAMSITPEPIVGREVNLHIEISTVSAAPNTVLTVTLSSGVELVSGDLHWQGKLEPGQSVGIDLTIRVMTEGEWPVSAYAFSPDTPGSRFGVGAGKALYIQSSVNSAEVIEDINRETTPIPVIQYGPDTPRPPTPATP